MTGPITCQPALQQAIYDRLTGDAQLMSLITGVYDELPDDVSSLQTPYIVLADLHEVPAEAHDRTGIDASIVVNMWSRYRGYAEVGAINARVTYLLHRPVDTLLVPGFQNVSIKLESDQFMRDPDPDLRRCMARYTIWLEEEK